VTRQQLLNPTRSGENLRCGKLNKASHRVIRTVPSPDLHKPVPDLDLLSVRTRSHIAVAQGISYQRVSRQELRTENRPEATHVRLDLGARVVGNQAHQRLVDSGPSQVSSPIKGMKPSVDQVWSVADVVKPRGSHQEIAGATQTMADVPGLRSNSHDVSPAPRQ